MDASINILKNPNAWLEYTNFLKSYTLFISNKTTVITKFAFNNIGCIQWPSCLKDKERAKGGLSRAYNSRGHRMCDYWKEGYYWSTVERCWNVLRPGWYLCCPRRWRSRRRSWLYLLRKICNVFNGVSHFNNDCIKTNVAGVHRILTRINQHRNTWICLIIVNLSVQ